MTRYTYQITDDARGAYDKWYKALPRDEESVRLHSIGFRLMLLLAFDLGKREVDLEVIQAVTALLDWQYSVRMDLRPIQGKTEAAKCSSAILRLLKSGPKTQRDFVRNGFFKTYDPAVVRRTLTELSSENAPLIRNKPWGKAKGGASELTEEA